MYLLFGCAGSPIAVCSARASHCGGFSGCGAQAVGTWASVVVVEMFSFPMVCGIFLDQGLNPIPYIGRQILYH